MSGKVVIVGGGYGGSTLAKALDETMDVVLVDPKDAFVHSVAALRGLVSAEWAPRVFYPYGNLLQRGVVIRDRVVAVDEKGVTTAAGTRIDADYIVLASGSTYPFPAKMDVDDSLVAQHSQAATREELERAERVLLVGAGPVGLELAGEISERWPEKKITIVDVTDEILAGDQYLPGLRSSLREQLEARGVSFLLGSPLAGEPATPPGVAGALDLRTEDGRTVQADIWFRCYGVRPVSDYLQGELAGARHANGALEVDAHLRLVGAEHVYAIGDVTAVPEPKRAGAAQRHADVVAKNIQAHSAGRPVEEVYRPGPGVALIPLGSTGGDSQVPGPDGPVLIGAEATARNKGTDLMTARYAETFGLADR